MGDTQTLAWIYKTFYITRRDAISAYSLLLMKPLAILVRVLQWFYNVYDITFEEITQGRKYLENKQHYVNYTKVIEWIYLTYGFSKEDETTYMK